MLTHFAFLMILYYASHFVRRRPNDGGRAGRRTSSCAHPTPTAAADHRAGHRIGHGPSRTEPDSPGRLALIYDGSVLRTGPDRPQPDQLERGSTKPIGVQVPLYLCESGTQRSGWEPHEPSQRPATRSLWADSAHKRSLRLSLGNGLQGRRGGHPGTSRSQLRRRTGPTWTTT